MSVLMGEVEVTVVCFLMRLDFETLRALPEGRIPAGNLVGPGISWTRRIKPVGPTKPKRDTAHQFDWSDQPFLGRGASIRLVRPALFESRLQKGLVGPGKTERRPRKWLVGPR